MDIVLQSAVKTFGTTFDFIPLEFEQVVLRALLEAYAKGEAHAHAKPTVPSRMNAFGIPTGVIERLQEDEGPWPASEVTPLKRPHPIRKREHG